MRVRGGLRALSRLYKLSTGLGFRVEGLEFSHKGLRFGVEGIPLLSGSKGFPGVLARV